MQGQWLRTLFHQQHFTETVQSHSLLAAAERLLYCRKAP